MKKATILTLLIIVLTALQIRAQYAPISTIGVVNSNLTSVMVPIRSQNFSNITDCSLKIMYNPAIINATGVTAGPLLPGTIYAITSSPGIIEITWFTWPPVNLPDNSLIFNLAFSKVSSGTSPISFSDDGYSCLWGDGNYNELIDIPTSTYYINGSLTFGMAPVTTAPVVPVCSGTTVSVPVTVTNFDNIGQVYGLKMLYNSSVLTYLSYTNNSGFPGLTVNGATPGIITVPQSISTSPTGVTYPANTVLFTLEFLYNGGSTALTWSDNGTSCLYRGPSPTFTLLTDTPTSTFYHDGSVSPLIAPTIIRNPDVPTVCSNAQVSATFTAGSGGVDPADHYESSIDAGITWQSYVPGSILTETMPGTAQIQIRAWRTSSGSGCTNTDYSTTSWDVVQGSDGGTLAGSTTVCAGTNSTILTLSGYIGTIVKWQSSPDGFVWSDIANTLPSFTATDLVSTLHFRAVVTNGTCDPANSSVATVTVNQIVPVSVSIAADANPSCTGNPVTFTASPVNGGPNPMFQWRLNGTDVPGATNSTWTYVPLHNDGLTCTLNSGEMCITGNPAVSGTLTMTVNPIPVVTAASLQASLNPSGPWSPVSGELGSGFQMCIDPAIEFYYFDLSSLTASQPLLPDNLNPFNIDTTNLPPTWLAYWAGRGVVNSSGNQYPWQNQMWLIIHGLAPVFYINYSITGDYQLVDGLTWQLGGGLTPLRLSGDYPQWNYSYAGTVKDQNYCISSFFDVYLELNTIPVVVDATLQVSTNQTGPWNAVTGDLPTGYDLCIDPEIEFYYMDINTLTISHALLASNLNPFLLDTTNLPANWLIYWAGRGVNNSSGNQYPWQDQMWQIIHGLAPIFYLNYTSGGDYQLIDGLTHQVGGGDIPLRVSGDYPEWNYTYTGFVTDVHDCPSTFFDIFMEFRSIPNVNPVADQSFCDGEIVPEVILTGNIAGTTFSWENDHPEIGLPASGVGDIPAFYAIISGEVPVTAIITVTPSTNGCSGEPAALYSIRVSPIMPVGVTIACGNTEVCPGSPATITSAVTFGGTEPTYKWFVNGGEVTGATNATYTYIPANQDVITCEVISNDRCATDNPATSNEIMITLKDFKPVSVSITADDQDVCAGTTVTFNSFATNGGTSPSYKWFVNAVEATGATNATFACIPQNSDEVACEVTSSEECVSGNPALSNVLTITVTETKPVSIVIVADDPDVCIGTVVTFSATTFNGGTAPAYKWFVNGGEVSGATDATYAYVPVNLDAVTCEVTSNEVVCITGNPATSNTISITVYPLLPVGVSILPDANPVYEGMTVTLTATAVNGGVNPAYKWVVNTLEVPGATNATYSYIPANNDAIVCVVTSDATCTSGSPAASNTVTMIVDPNLPVSVTIVANENPVCNGSPVTFTATPVNGGETPAYQWVVNNVAVSGATDVIYSYIPSNNDAVYCILTSSLEHASGNPATSNTILMTVTLQLVVENFIAASANPVCAGTLVNYLSVPVNGGSSPIYQWKVNAADVPGATNAAYEYIPVHGDVVTCLLISSELCTLENPVLSNPVAMMVNPSQPVSVTIAADANPVCDGTTVNFSATPVNEGVNPGYQWQVNTVAVPGATSSGYSFVPANNDVVVCVLTSEIACGTGSPATSDPVAMTVNQLVPVSVTIAADAGTVCSGTIVNFTATPVNGGDAPAFQWIINSISISGATNATYSYSPVNGDNVKCVLTSNAACTTGSPATSNTLAMVVNQAPVPGISGTNSACAGTSNLLYLTESGMTGYSWTISGGGTITFNAGAAIFVTWHTAGNQWIRLNYVGSNGCSAATPTQYNVTVHALPVPVLSGAITACAGTTGVVYTTEAGMSNYSWSLSPGGTNTSGGTSGSNTMTVTWNTTGAQWVRVSYTSAAGCAAASPTTLDVSVSEPVPASVSIAASENPVNAGVPVIFTATAVNGGPTPGYQWKVNGADINGATDVTYTYVPLNNDAVLCLMTSSLSCVSGSPAASNTVIMTVNGIPVNLTVQNVTVVNLQTECFNALDTILVAGGITTFVVENGGTANFIAGKAIRYLPGTRVDLGGMMTGIIAPEGPFCGGALPPVVAAVVAGVVAGVEPSPVNLDQAWFTIYPNPTSGNFTLVQKGNKSYGNVRVEIFTMTGERVLLSTLARENKHEFNLSEVPAGLYFVKVIGDDFAETIKLIRTK